MEPVVVVGAGIAGVACARELQAAGLPVRVLDRGRRVGGRMASPLTDGRPVDTGASYLTAADPAFVPVVQDWVDRRLARRWTDTFAVLDGDGGLAAKTGPTRYGAAGGLRSLVEDLAAGLEVESGRTAQRVAYADGALTVDGHRAAAVVLAVPDPQAVRLLDDSLADERAALDAGFAPVLALTATFAERPWDLDGVFVHGDPVLDWVADDGRRRGDGAPVLVAHSTAEFARPHLPDPAAAAGAMVEALRDRLGLAEPVGASVHRWTYAKPAGTRDQPYLLTDRLLGACGDGWSTRPRVEAAWLSGHRLGRALVERLA